MGLHEVPFYNIPYGRKEESWDSRSIPDVTSEAALLALRGLPVYSAEATPMLDIPADRPQYFIVERPNGDRFVVNTEGYNYCRYVARIPKETK